MKPILLITFLIAAASAAPGTLDSHPGFRVGYVVGGSEADRHQYPHIVSLQTSSHFCGGSIINENWVITAAHCLIYNSYSIVAGAHNIKQNEETVQKRSNAFDKAHERYTGGVGPYDVGVIRVNSPFTFNQFVKAINLPAAEKIHSGQVDLSGWGSTSTGIFPIMPNNLQHVELPIVPYSQCEAAIPGSPLHETNVCTGPLTGGLSACSGDSGGPLIQQGELVGIVSWGYIPCGSNGRPSVYTRTSAHIAWINENIKY